MIRIDHVSKSYDGGATNAVRDLTLEIQSGEIFGLLGPNGAGKSTLLNMLAGVLAPSSGVIELDGVNVATDPARRQAQPLLRERLAPTTCCASRGTSSSASSRTSTRCPTPCAARASQASRASMAWRESWTTRSSPTPTACARR